MESFASFPHSAGGVKAPRSELAAPEAAVDADDLAGDEAGARTGQEDDHLGDLAARTYLVAGPPPMVESVVEALAGAGVPEEQVLPSRFSGY